MRTLYDSVTATDIPVSAQMVAGYVDGYPPWSAQDWARFPNAVKVGIAVFASTNAGQVLDVENGNATPEQAPGWAQMRRAAGQDPTVYCSESVWPAVRAAFQAQGIAEPHYWIAYWNGDGLIGPGMVAHQYANPALSGGHYDLSAVVDFWPGVDPEGPPIPPVPGATVGPLAVPVEGHVYDTPTNDRSIVDYDSDTYVIGQIASIGEGIRWDRAKEAKDPAGRWASKWLLGWAGSKWASWADTVSSGNDPIGTPTDPTKFANPPPAPPPPPPNPGPTPTPNLDALRASWAQLAGILINDVPKAAQTFQAELDKLANLP